MTRCSALHTLDLKLSGAVCEAKGCMCFEFRIEVRTKDINVAAISLLMVYEPR